MFLISSNGLALWFATTGCWCEPDSRFEKESLLAPTRRDSQEIPTNIKIIARRGKLLKSESAQITRDRDPGRRSDYIGPVIKLGITRLAATAEIF